MASTIILSDNGASSGSAGLKTTGGNDGVLILQTTTSGGTATNAIYVDNSQNVGLGTSSPVSKVHAYGSGQLLTLESNADLSTSAGSSFLRFKGTNGNSGYIGFGGTANTLYVSNALSGPMIFETIGAERMRIDSSGNVGIGTSSPDTGVHLRVYGNAYYTAQYGTGNKARYGADANGAFTEAVGATPITFYTNSTERARIDSNGNLLVGTTNASLTTGVGVKFTVGTTNAYMGIVTNEPVGTNSSYHLYNLNASYSGYRFYVTANGGVYNYSGNNTNLSDERTKKNIELAGGYLDKICAIPVKLFNYKDEPENEQRTLGVIAQDVEAAAPELVNQDGWLGEAPEGEAPLKSIYTTDMMFALMKAIQEQQALINNLTERITALEAK